MTKKRRSPGTHVDRSRSELMRRVQAKNTGPERTVRQAAHSLGYRFRLHRRDLPGTPDLTFPGPRKVIFVHGCFWHRHVGCTRTTTPKTRTGYWLNKFAENMKRDGRNLVALRALGWEVLIVWECKTFDGAQLRATLRRFLE